jgi:hypothetical protein
MTFDLLTGTLGIQVFILPWQHKEGMLGTSFKLQSGLWQASRGLAFAIVFVTNPRDF